MIEQLRQRLQALQKPAALDGTPGCLPLGVTPIDAALGGGLARGALHEIAAPSEAHLAAATGFMVGLASLRSDARAANSSSPLPWGEVGARSAPGEGLRPIESRLPPHPTSLRSVDLSPQGRGEERKSIAWLAEDMALAESGAPCGLGLAAFGSQPRAPADGRNRARAGSVVGDGGSAALPRDGCGDRRMAARRHRSRRNAAAVARRRRQRRVRAVVARLAGARRLHRRHALDRRGGAFFILP